MTNYEKRRWTRMQKRVRTVELLLKVTLAVIVVATLAIIATVVATGARQEPREPVAEEPAQVEQKPATEPAEAEKEPRYDITEDELNLVARVVYAEAGGEGFDGMALVAQCILNTAEAKGQRPDEVVLTPKQYTEPAAEASEEALEAVKAVFVDGHQVTDEPIRWFYNPQYGTSKWHESKTHVLTYKNHKFFA